LEALRALSPFRPPQDGVGSPPETRSNRFSTLARSGGRAYDGAMLELSKSVRGERRVASQKNEEEDDKPPDPETYHQRENDRCERRGEADSRADSPLSAMLHLGSMGSGRKVVFSHLPSARLAGPCG